MMINRNTKSGFLKGCKLSCKILIVLTLISLLGACQSKDPGKNWQFDSKLELDDVNPIGLAENSEGLWLSDGDHNRLVLVNEEGESVKTLDSLDRPMHITNNKEILLVPQYGNDEVLLLNRGNRKVLTSENEWDAPAGVASYGEEWAVADFYNHRVVYFNGESSIIIGKEGKAEGEFYYPTDVQITETRIWVADAYNNRVQVFDKTGQFLQSMGESEKINAATGIFVDEVQVFVTDFENDRVLVYDHQGNFIQELEENIDKPTDILIVGDILYITNYRKGELISFK